MGNNASKVPMKTLVQQDSVQRMLEKTLQGKAQQFATSLVNVVNNNEALKNVDQLSVINSAMVAASLDLPIDQNLGFMWLVPYGGKATPQIGYKGYIQLALRTGQYKRLNTVVIYEGEMESWNPLTEDFKYNPQGKTSDKAIGYLGFFRMINGFEKTVYWTKEEIENHRMKFSKLSGKPEPSGVWKSNYDAMALKTVMRNLLSKWGIMSVEMQQAVSQDEEVPQTSEFEIETEDEDIANFAARGKGMKKVDGEEDDTKSDETPETKSE